MADPVPDITPTHRNIETPQRAAIGRKAISPTGASENEGAFSDSPSRLGQDLILTLFLNQTPVRRVRLS